MKVFKAVLSLLSTMCLAGLVITQNTLFAVGLLAFSSLRLGVMIGEKSKNKPHEKQ